MMQTARCFSQPLSCSSCSLALVSAGGVTFMKNAENRMFSSCFEALSQRKGMKISNKMISASGVQLSTSAHFQNQNKQDKCRNKKIIPSSLLSNIQQKRYLSSQKIVFKKLHVMGPLRWLDVKAKMFLLRGFFDKDFDQEEFLKGAKQAICLVSSYIAKEKFKDLSELLSKKAEEDSKQIYFDETDKAKIEIKEDDIEMLRISNLGFVYEENGKKWVDILVTCFCAADDPISKRIGHIDINLPSYRTFNFAFLREYTPGVTSNWIVNRIEMFRNF